MRIYILLALFALFQIKLSAQISDGGTPPSHTITSFKSAEETKGIQLEKLNVQKQLKRDIKDGVENRYSVYTEKNIDIIAQGSQTKLDNGTIWRYTIECDNALSIGLIFKNYKLPQGAQLFIYNTNRSTIYGAFTHKNNKKHETLAIADFPGNELTLEYFEPNNAEFKGKLLLGSIGQAYKAISDLQLKSTEDEHVDINCSEGDLHQLEKHAVAKITYSQDGSGYICTGALVNNAKSDGTPYFLTAHHCISTDASAQTLVTLFNYEHLSCGGSPTSGQSLSGSELIATGKNTDFTLLLLSVTPPSNYSPYYAGINYASDDSVVTGTGIHHPGGQPKKISIDYNTIYSYPFETRWTDDDVSPENTHWISFFDVGFTEGGSSGSPLFDSSNRVIGQLHGGGDEHDLYGKISQSWNSIKTTLDPAGITNGTIDGYYPDGIAVEPNFKSDFTQICNSTAIVLTDLSIFDPESWNWTFTPNSVTYHKGTSNSSQNPIVSFDVDASYTVSLETTKNSNTETKTKTDYLEVGDGLNVNILAKDDTMQCPSLFQGVSLSANGASNYQWRVDDPFGIVVFDSAALYTPNLELKKNDTAFISYNATLEIQLIGQHGSCSDSAQINVTFDGPINDNIADAIELSMGKHGVFTNICASVEENEPNPIGGDCNSQIAWCECDVSDIIIDNSVWFKFIGPESGIVSVNVPGFDNQVAIYEADTASDIMSGDPSKYKIIAANDDYLPKGEDYSALIEKANVISGKMYWMQVDGSACGALGNFMIELYPQHIADTGVTSIDAETKATSHSLNTFPNPCSSDLYFSVEDFDSHPQKVMIHTLHGQEIMTLTTISEQNKQYRIKLPIDIANGVYILSVITEEHLYTNTISVIN